MQTRWILLLLLCSSQLWAQAPETGASVRGSVKGGTRDVVMYRKELGKWWQNSETAKKLQLSDGQIGQLDQIFYDHRVKLIDYGAEMAKQDLKLQTLVDADVPDEAQVNIQVDQVLAARGKLEREYTMMNLDLRKVLSIEQWRQLKSIRGDGGGFGEKIFFHQKLAPGSPAPLPGGPPGATFELPIPPPLEDGSF
jgi:Spy/CpxP family protein refolding chaperone